MNTKVKLILAAKLALVVLASSLFFILLKKKNSTDVKQINIYYPFSMSPEIDPRAIYSVADQVVCEHVYAFHGYESFKLGFSPLASDTTIDREAKKIIIRPRYKMKRSDGTEFTINDICSSLKASFAGTIHAPVASLVTNVLCGSEQIEISLKSIPVNIQHLFTLPDFSLFDPSLLPISKTKLSSTTGAYHIRCFPKYAIEPC